MKRVKIKPIVESSVEPNNINVIWKDGDEYKKNEDCKWIAVNGGGGGGAATSIIRPYIDQVIKFYIDDSIDENTVLGVKGARKVQEDVFDSSDLGGNLSGLHTYTTEVINVPECKLYEYPDYSSTLDYIKSISVPDITIQDLILCDYSYQQYNEIGSELLYIPDYGILRNTKSLATHGVDENASETIALFLFVAFVYNYNSTYLPLFCFDRYNQNNGGTAIDWSKIFPDTGVKYRDLK